MDIVNSILGHYGRNDFTIIYTPSRAKTIDNGLKFR